MNLSVMYRGPLSSCNYACGYCPFAKREETTPQLAADRAALSRFTSWIAEQAGHDFRILFTPWGEALVRRWYREALIALSHLANVRSVAIQTNLSCSWRWIEGCRGDRVAVWATFHPTQAELQTFVAKIKPLHSRGIRVCVGVIAVPDHFTLIAQLRDELPADVYLWINAQQPRPRRYTPEEVSFLTSIDPLFALTATKHQSFNAACRTGESVFTVDGRGDMRRCHFVDKVIGNIYLVDWEASLRPRTCPNGYCQCYVGFAHLVRLRLEQFFGEGLLERIPGK
jgi:MoaA/NifB/PqqE/SkfB family radical SAM enzyme